MEEGERSLNLAKGNNPNIDQQGGGYLTTYYSPTGLDHLYHRLGAKNRRMIQDASQISLIYLSIDTPTCKGEMDSALVI
jgi:hypothetical protein